MVEAVFPTCAIFLLMTDDLMSENSAALTALISGEAHRERGGKWYFLGGSRADGLTMTPRWGHPWPDSDQMYLFGAQLGVNIPRKYQSTQSSSSSSTPQDYYVSKSCLEYAPDDCPPAYTKLRVTDVKAMMEWYPDVITLSGCVEESDGHSWLNTARLNKLIMQAYNEEEDDAGERTTGINGPAGQVK